MALKTRTQLKALFETGDIPDENAYGDLIDSNLNLVETTAQSFASTIAAPGVAANVISANQVYTTNLITTNLCANTIVVSSLVCADVIKASSVQYKHAYGQVWGTDFNKMSSMTSGIVRISALTTSHGEVLNVGFSANRNGRLTYQGAVTAKFIVRYNVNTHVNPGTPSQNAFYSLYKNSAQVALSRELATDQSSRWQNRAGIFLVEMKTNDFLELYYENTATSNYTLNIHGFSIVAYPVSWN